MRSPDAQQPGLFSYVSVEERVPATHPIRRLRVLVDALLLELNEELDRRYSKRRPSVVPVGTFVARQPVASDLQRVQRAPVDGAVEVRYSSYDHLTTSGRVFPIRTCLILMPAKLARRISLLICGCDPLKICPATNLKRITRLE